MILHNDFCKFTRIHPVNIYATILSFFMVFCSLFLQVYVLFYVCDLLCKGTLYVLIFMHKTHTESYITLHFSFYVVMYR